ncbi:MULTISPECIES: SHOCT domain-containing protein [unclassified Knoellia]|uniref:SHOCT domain-containing protein n=1 Tax=Knoellia altitudinis TaxID=3404795 RepID=UPI00361597F1
MSTLLTTAAALPLHDDRWSGGGPGPWFILFPIFWFLVIAGLITAVRFGGGRRWRRFQAAEGSRAGEARLAERFAAGEIDEQEYEARRAVLRRGSQT